MCGARTVQHGVGFIIVLHIGYMGCWSTTSRTIMQQQIPEKFPYLPLLSLYLFSANSWCGCAASQIVGRCSDILAASPTSIEEDEVEAAGGGDTPESLSGVERERRLTAIAYRIQEKRILIECKSRYEAVVEHFSKDLGL